MKDKTTGADIEALRQDIEREAGASVVLHSQTGALAFRLATTNGGNGRQLVRGGSKDELHKLGNAFLDGVRLGKGE